MSNCKDCGAPMSELFTSVYCSAECAKPVWGKSLADTHVRGGIYWSDNQQLLIPSNTGPLPAFSNVSLSVPYEEVYGKPEKLYPEYTLDLTSQGVISFTSVDEDSPEHMWEDMCAALEKHVVGRKCTPAMEIHMNTLVRNWLMVLAEQRALYYSDYDKCWWYNGNAGRRVIR